MASLVLSGDTSGSVTLAAPAVAGSTTQTLVDVTGTLAPIVSGTAVTCAGQTSIDFTGLPSWAKRITVMFNGVSTSGTSIIQIRLGSGGVVTTGYSAQAWSASTHSGVVTSGFYISNANAAARTWVGQLTLLNVSNNVWVATGITNVTDVGNVGYQSSGVITLSGVLDQVRITTVNGTDTFDTTPSAGTINILYE